MRVPALDKKGTHLGPISSIFLAGLDQEKHGWCGHAVALSNLVIAGFPEMARAAAARYWSLKVAPRLPPVGWNGGFIVRHTEDCAAHGPTARGCWCGADNQ